MKVLSVFEPLRFAQKVREKDSPDGHGREQKQPQQDPSQDQRDKEDKEKTSYAAVEKAVSEFDGNSQVQGHGLVASTEGQGPGLRVVLRDGRGAVVRQFTGEEFVRLREAATDGAPHRGRLLDKKL